MKNEKVMLWGSFIVLFAAIGFFAFAPASVKKVDTNTTSVPLTNASSTDTRTSSSTSQVPDERFNTKTWSATYKSEAFGFTLTFPDSWSGYRPKETARGVDFGVEDQENVFSVNVYTLKDWDSEVKNAGGKVLPTVLKKNDTHVFVVERAQDFTEKVMPLISVYPSILTTFTIK